MGKTGAVEKLQLHEHFVDGKTDEEISRLIGRVPSTIAYHRRMWEKSGSPLPPTRIPPTPAIDPAPGRKPTLSESEPSPPPAVPIPQPAPATPSPLKPEPAKAHALWKEPDKPRRTLQAGEWYEGAVAVIGDTYVLVDLIELAEGSGRSPRGMLHWSNAAANINPATRYIHEELIQVQVLTTEYNSRRGRMDITLSTKTEAEREAERAPSPAVKPERGHQAPAQAPTATQAPVSYRPSPNLCDHCIKQDVCPVVAMLTLAVESADIGTYNNLRIKLHPLQVQECGSYRAEEVR